jgi:hypothetical protein
MPAYTQNQLFGSVASTRPTKQSDGTLVNARYDGYGAAHVIPTMPWRHAQALDGAYYSFFSATLDVATTEAGHAAPVLADVDATLVKAVAFLRNIGTGNYANKKIVLDWMKIHTVLAGANGTSSFWHAQIGTTTRYTSGGVALTVASTNTDVASAASDIVTAYNGPIVIAAENSTTRNIGQGVQRDGIEVAGDTTTFLFGHDPIATSNVEAASGTHDLIHLPPVALPAGAEFILGRGQVAQSVAGVYKIMGGFYLV